MRRNNKQNACIHSIKSIIDEVEFKHQSIIGMTIQTTVNRRLIIDLND